MFTSILKVRFKPELGLGHTGPMVLPDAGQLQSGVPVGPVCPALSILVGLLKPRRSRLRMLNRRWLSEGVSGERNNLTGCSASESVQREEEAAQAFSRIIHVNVNVTYLRGE